VLLLAACAGNSNRAAITDMSEGAGSSYRVRAGDTLYAISWRYGFDYRQLAKTNNIEPPYRIQVGQVLLLQNPGQVTSRSGQGRNSTNNYSNTRTKSTSKNRNQTTSSSVKASSDSSDRESMPRAFSGRWQWPANGTVIKGYNTGGTPHKGIDIGGKLGESVYAAAAGEVVYAGNGLVGYGNLLILRHDDEYLSAYGHNSKLLIREGDVVKAGQRIAEMGDSGADRVKLHFEIRFDGKPVNPTGLLPKR
jgi:lipoprotein NlpD